MIRGLGADDPPQIGPYRLVARLGSGGMGRIFLGRSAGGRLVAVKVIRAELAEEPGFRARFAREVAAARKVSGLFTAVLVDADSDGPVPWLATGYVPGPSLAEAVTRHGPLPVPSVVTLAAGLAEALDVIHDSGVIHRDLKPSNVLIADDGPRVIDFGISRAAEGSVLTQTGSVMGSPGFMSPEQAEGGEISPASDVFSLGALLTFAATGEGPFGTGSMPALLYRVVHRPPSLDRLPAELRPMIERCLIKDPRERVTTGELLAELDSTGPAADWLPASVADALGQLAESVRVAAGPVQLAVPAQLALPAQRAAGTAQLADEVLPAADGVLPAAEGAAPAAERVAPAAEGVAPAAEGPLGVAAGWAAEPSHAAGRIPAAAAAAPAAAMAAPLAVEDRPTSDFRMTDPSVPGLPLRLDGDRPPSGSRSHSRGGGPWSPGDASGLAVGGRPAPAGAPSQAARAPWSPGGVSDLADSGHSPAAGAPSRAASPPWSPGRMSDLAGPGRVSDLAGPGQPSPTSAPSSPGGQLWSLGGVAGPTVGDRSPPGGAPPSPGSSSPSPGGTPSSPASAPPPPASPPPPLGSGPYGSSRSSAL
ncbi:MAG TPA: protein kinase, partial [Streptosporangiaceae bacterium]|nr:protein kinase [Streptosporangiaceae bacterium]